MTVIPAELGGDPQGVDTQFLEHAPPTQLPLITEHEVLLASAPAIAGSSPKQQRRSALTMLTAALQHLVPRSPKGERRHYPGRTPTWYSDALMAREIHRL